MPFTITINPVGGWILNDMSQPATFSGGLAAFGPQGEAGSVDVGTVTTLPAGDPATVQNVGTNYAAILNFGIPQGDKGDKGDQGDPGPQGIPGVVAATAPILYDAGTQTVSIDPAYKPNPFDQSLNSTDEVDFKKINLSDGGIGSAEVDSHWQGNGITHTVLTNTAKIAAFSGFNHTTSTGSISVSVSGITFPDATVQTTAGISPATAASTYQTISGMSAYYLASNPAGYITSAALSPYITSSTAAATYYPLTNPAGYISSSTAASTYYPLTNPAGYITDIPAASTTVAGKVELATDAEAIAGSSTTLAVTPSGNFASSKSFSFIRLRGSDLITSLTSGGTNSVTPYGGELNITSTVSGSYSLRGLYNSNQGSIVIARAAGVIDWAKKVWIGARISRKTAIDANCVFRLSLGKTAGDSKGNLPAARNGIGFVLQGTGNFQVQASNGTANIVSTNGTVGLLNLNAVDVEIYSDGTGTVILSVNGTQVASTTGGPTTVGASTANGFTIEIENVATASAISTISLGQLFIRFEE